MTLRCHGRWALVLPLRDEPSRTLWPAGTQEQARQLLLHKAATTMSFKSHFTFLAAPRAAYHDHAIQYGRCVPDCLKIICG